jgi:hypothetical protein
MQYRVSVWLQPLPYVRPEGHPLLLPSVGQVSQPSRETPTTQQVRAVPCPADEAPLSTHRHRHRHRHTSQAVPQVCKHHDLLLLEQHTPPPNPITSTEGRRRQYVMPSHAAQTHMAHHWRLHPLCAHPQPHPHLSGRTGQLYPCCGGAHTRRNLLSQTKHTSDVGDQLEALVCIVSPGAAGLGDIVNRKDPHTPPPTQSRFQEDTGRLRTLSWHSHPTQAPPSPAAGSPHRLLLCTLAEAWPCHCPPEQALLVASALLLLPCP